jgi:cyclophilin family peptidyl-prolyl cis-trans isomerase
MKVAYAWLLLGLLPVSLSAGTLVQFRTTVGDIDVELFDRDKPITVQNFIRYVKSGAYQNTFLHRCVPNFIVQGGGLRVSNPADTNFFEAYSAVPSFGQITNEFNVGPRISNSYGTIAMAKLGTSADSATSQWFFNLTNNGPNLDSQNGGFTVFGRVVHGTNVLNDFNSRDKNTASRIVDLRWWFPTATLFSDLPVSYIGTNYPRYADLVYTYDISLLSVQVRLGANGGREISWRSVAAATNYLEFTAGLPPTWQLLAATNGTGNTVKMTDESPGSTRRFYRVRVDY